MLFIGDDIIADERLLEAHLRAHAARREPGAAVLGHIDWPAEMRPSAVMDFVCGESSLQFAYALIPRLPRLDYRFFYTSNISIRREFMQAAAADGIRFDPDFRLSPRSRIPSSRTGWRSGGSICGTAPTRWRITSTGWISRASRAASTASGRWRWCSTGSIQQMDEMLQVRWIGDWADAVDLLAARPELASTMRAVDADTDALLRSLASALDGLIALQVQGGFPVAGAKANVGGLTRALHGVLGLIFDVERTRGKIEAWYGSVENRDTVDAAKRLMATMRKLEFFSAHHAEIRKLEGTISWLNTDVVAGLKRRVADLERQLGLPGGRLRLRRLDPAAYRVARKVDLLIQQQLSGRTNLLDQYQAVRGRLKRLIRPAQSTPR